MPCDQTAAAAAVSSPAACGEQHCVIFVLLLYHSGAIRALPCQRRKGPTPLCPTPDPEPPSLPPQVATERLAAHKMRRDGVALERPSSLRVSSSQPELRRRKEAREWGATPLPAAGSTSVAAVSVMHPAHAAHTARYVVAMRRRVAWNPPSQEGLHNRIPPPSTLTSFRTSPPSNGAPAPVAVSPSAPCFLRRGELPPLWRPERPRPWQGARYGEPLPSKLTPRAAPSALPVPCTDLRLWLSPLSCLQSHPYSATR